MIKPNKKKRLVAVGFQNFGNESLILKIAEVWIVSFLAKQTMITPTMEKEYTENWERFRRILKF